MAGKKLSDWAGEGRREGQVGGRSPILVQASNSTIKRAVSAVSFCRRTLGSARPRLVRFTHGRGGVTAV